MIPAEVMEHVRRIQIRTKRAVTDLFAGQYKSVFKGRGMEFKEVREYVPGDDVRSIEWNVTARTGKPHVKLLEEERELTVMLLVDASASSRFGSVDRFKNDVAAEVCALLGASAIANNDKVGLILFTDTVEQFLPPAKGRNHALRVIRDVLCFVPRRAGTDIGAALRFLNDVSQRRVVAFVLSDFLTEGYEPALRAANRRHDIIAAVLSDPREEALPDVGFLAVQDAETGREVLLDTGKAAVREGYARAARRRARVLKETLRRNRVDAMHIRTDRPYADEVFRFFRARERRHA